MAEGVLSLASSLGQAESRRKEGSDWGHPSRPLPPPREHSHSPEGPGGGRPGRQPSVHGHGCQWTDVIRAEREWPDLQSKGHGHFSDLRRAGCVQGQGREPC